MIICLNNWFKVQAPTADGRGTNRRRSCFILICRRYQLEGANVRPTDKHLLHWKGLSCSSYVDPVRIGKFIHIIKLLWRCVQVFSKMFIFTDKLTVIMKLNFTPNFPKTQEVRPSPALNPQASAREAEGQTIGLYYIGYLYFGKFCTPNFNSEHTLYCMYYIMFPVGKQPFTNIV